MSRRGSSNPSPMYRPVARMARGSSRGMAASLSAMACRCLLPRPARSTTRMPTTGSAVTSARSPTSTTRSSASGGSGSIGGLGRERCPGAVQPTPGGLPSTPTEDRPLSLTARSETVSPRSRMRQIRTSGSVGGPGRVRPPGPIPIGDGGATCGRRLASTGRVSVSRWPSLSPPAPRCASPSPRQSGSPAPRATRREPPADSEWTAVIGQPGPEPAGRDRPRPPRRSGRRHERAVARLPE